MQTACHFVQLSASIFCYISLYQLYTTSRPYYHSESFIVLKLRLSEVKPESRIRSARVFPQGIYLSVYLCAASHAEALRSF